MKPTIYRPFVPAFRGLMDEFFPKAMTSVFGGEDFFTTPAVNVKDLEQSFHLEVAAPGLNKDDFKIEVENGTGEVRMCAELQEGPTCSAAQIKDCEDKNWDPACACNAYGSLKIEAPEPWSANVTVDFPNTIWANVIIDGGKGSGDNSCPAVLDNCSGACGPITQSPETPQIAKAEYNYPGDPAIPGVGYIFDIKVHSCEAVPYVDGPDDYDAKAIDSPKDELRGNVKVCTGCLASL